MVLYYFYSVTTAQYALPYPVVVHLAAVFALENYELLFLVF
jgi:hypothetical protein